MGKIKNRLFAIYFPLTAVIIVLEHMSNNDTILLNLKFATMVSLCLCVQIFHKEHKEQKILAKAYLFMVISDFFLVFLKNWFSGGNLKTYGAIGFTVAYLIMIYVYKKFFVIKKGQIFTGIVIYGIFFSQIFRLRMYMNLTTIITGALFGIVICSMTVMAVSIFIVQSFSKRNSALVALSGILMLICDLVVAVNGIDPSIGEKIILYILNVIWLAYVPGWTMLASVILNEKLFE